MSLPLSSASKSSPIKSDLMQDARVRAVIKENLYRGLAQQSAFDASSGNMGYELNPILGIAFLPSLPGHG